MDTYTPSPVWTTSVSLPQGGDPRNVATIRPGIEASLDRTQFLADRLRTVLTYEHHSSDVTAFIPATMHTFTTTTWDLGQVYELADINIGFPGLPAGLEDGDQVFVEISGTLLNSSGVNCAIQLAAKQGASNPGSFVGGAWVPASGRVISSNNYVPFCAAGSFLVSPGNREIGVGMAGRVAPTGSIALLSNWSLRWTVERGS